jgi:hypothetical protein
VADKFSTHTTLLCAKTKGNEGSCTQRRLGRTIEIEGAATCFKANVAKTERMGRLTGVAKFPRTHEEEERHPEHDSKGERTWCILGAKTSRGGVNEFDRNRLTSVGFGILFLVIPKLALETEIDVARGI